MKPSLFSYGQQQLAHSVGMYKIDCDHLSRDSLLALANMVVDQIEFNQAWGVPTGGVLFANALNEVNEQRGIPDTTRCLVVDDVLTTGFSMSNWITKEMGLESSVTPNKAAEKIGFDMLVIFDRNQLEVPDMDVKSLFRFNL